jgi:hypothetical protein
VLSVRSFLAAPRPTRAQATVALRLLFVAMFLGQTLVALLLFAVLAAVAGVQSGGLPLLGWVLVGLGLLQLPFAFTVSMLAVRAGGKRAALYGTLLSAVLLATPAWYAAFALLIGQATAAMILLALLSIAYALGFVLTGRFARLAVTPPPEPATVELADTLPGPEAPTP